MLSPILVALTLACTPARVCKTQAEFCPNAGPEWGWWCKSPNPNPPKICYLSCERKEVPNAKVSR